MTLVAIIVTTFLMPQPASGVTMPVVATWSTPAGLSHAASEPLPKPRPAAVTIAPVRLPPVGSGFVATIGFAALSVAMVVRSRQRKV